MADTTADLVNRPELSSGENELSSRQNQKSTGEDRKSRKQIE